MKTPKHPTRPALKVSFIEMRNEYNYILSVLNKYPHISIVSPDTLLMLITNAISEVLYEPEGLDIRYVCDEISSLASQALDDLEESISNDSHGMTKQKLYEDIDKLEALLLETYTYLYGKIQPRMLTALYPGDPEQYHDYDMRWYPDDFTFPYVVFGLHEC